MWLINSSIGRKVVMSVTGIALILFLTFHGCMNVVALFSGEAYNTICELLNEPMLEWSDARHPVLLLHFIPKLLLMPDMQVFPGFYH